MSRRVRGLSLNVDRPSQDHTTTHERTCIARPRIMLGLSFWTLRAVKLPPRSSNLNAHAERFVRTIKESCLDRLILFGEGSLRKAVHEFVEHYHRERNHQGLDNRLIMPEQLLGHRTGAMQRRPRLGGMLNCYYRQAA